MVSVLRWSGTADHALPSSATSSDLGRSSLLLRIRHEAAADALFDDATGGAHVVGSRRIHGHLAGNVVDVALGHALVDAKGATYALIWSVGQVVEDLEAALLADELGQRLEFEFESGHLLPGLLELVVIRLDLLLAPLVLFVKDDEVFLHDLFAARELMVH